MNLFGKKPQEEYMGKLIHDTNTEFARHTRYFQAMEKLMLKTDKTPEEDTRLSTYFYGLDESIQKLKAAVDAYYAGFKNDFKRKKP